MLGVGTGDARIGRYEILTRLSAGGMAEVFLARLVGPGGFQKLVVVKRILPELREDAEFVNLFYSEANITASLSHANIAQVFELGDEGGELFLALEFIPGLDLSRIARQFRQAKKRLPTGFSCRVVRDVCLALEHAHSHVDEARVPRPVIHRDIAPRNVMVSTAGIVKVIDFGIARVAGSVGLTAAGSIRGSVGYMSPEQVLADPLDGRSDLYSAGVLLYELLTATRLFDQTEPALAMQQVVRGDIRPIGELGVPEPLASVVMKAVARQPDDRHQTGKAMADAIEAAFPQLYDEKRIAAFLEANFSEHVQRLRVLIEHAREVRRAPIETMVDAAAATSMEETQTTPGGGLSAPEPASSSSSEIVAAPTPPSTILVVDDSAVGRKLVEFCLTPVGHQVIACESAEAALEMLVEMRPDLIILDVRMPGMNGFELCERIRAMPQLVQMPILFLSAACSIEERTKGLAAGADDFIRKPFEPADLQNRVRTHLLSAAAARSPAEAAKPA